MPTSCSTCSPLRCGGADLRYIQAFLGHESLESTKIYLRLVPADLREAYDRAIPEIAINGATA